MKEDLHAVFAISFGFRNKLLPKQGRPTFPKSACFKRQPRILLKLVTSNDQKANVFYMYEYVIIMSFENSDWLCALTNC